MSDQMPQDEELRSLYRALPADEPKAEMDDAILAAARQPRESSKPVRTADSRRGPSVRPPRAAQGRLLKRLSWGLPAAAAAGVVLTLTMSRLTSDRPIDNLRAPDPQSSKIAPESELRAYLSEYETAAPEADLPAPARERRTDEAGQTRMAEKAGAEKAGRQSADGSDRAADVPNRPKKERSTPEDVAGLSQAPAVRPEQPSEPAHEAAAKSKKPSAPAVPTGPLSGMLAMQDGMLAMQDQRQAGSESDSDASGLLREEAASPPRTTDDLRAEATAIEPEPWPLRLRPGLTAAEACAAVHTTVRSAFTCEFLHGAAVVEFAAPLPLEHRKLAGRTVTRLTLALRGEVLDSVLLELAPMKGNVSAGEKILFVTGEAP